MRKTLILVGTGIKSVSQMTLEASAHIENADKVLYLLNEPLLQEWVSEKAKESESLDNLYFEASARKANYEKITEKIITEIKKHDSLCIACYGHPTIFVQPFIAAAKKAESIGCDVQIIPGISSDACLLADLRIDPGDVGFCSYEATDIILKNKRLDTTSHLLIWQIGVIGNIGINFNKKNKKALGLLQKKLSQEYGPTHNCTLYEAARLPHLNPEINVLTIDELIGADISPIATLYIPPVTNNLKISDKIKDILIY